MFRCGHGFLKCTTLDRTAYGISHCMPHLWICAIILYITHLARTATAPYNRAILKIGRTLILGDLLRRVGFHMVSLWVVWVDGSVRELRLRDSYWEREERWEQT